MASDASNGVAVGRVGDERKDLRRELNGLRQHCRTEFDHLNATTQGLEIENGFLLDNVNQLERFIGSATPAASSSSSSSSSPSSSAAAAPPLQPSPGIQKVALPTVGAPPQPPLSQFPSQFGEPPSQLRGGVKFPRGYRYNNGWYPLCLLRHPFVYERHMFSKKHRKQMLSHTNGRRPKIGWLLPTSTSSLCLLLHQCFQWTWTTNVGVGGC